MDKDLCCSYGLSHTADIVAEESTLRMFGQTPALTDAKSLFDSARSASAGLRLTEERTAIEVCIVKERLNAMLGYLKWVNSTQQVEPSRVQKTSPPTSSSEECMHFGMIPTSQLQRKSPKRSRQIKRRSKMKLPYDFLKMFWRSRRSQKGFASCHVVESS